MPEKKWWKGGKSLLFSSLTFLFYFLPAVVLIHRLLPQKAQNPFLFAASLVFYAWGEIRYVPLFFALLLADYGLGLLLGRARGGAGRKALMALGVLVDIGALVYYKYSGFLLGSLGLAGRFSVPQSLPLGISFFTFQAVGYLIDVYRRQTEPERDIFAFGAFLFLFPQLIAGPIVRYGDLKAALHTRRRPGAEALDKGMALFVAGLASKVLLANPLGALSEELRAVTGDSACQWAHLTAYTLHIYFDFWGYSVMTLGMGRMLGFRFPRNFNHPYAAASITDFWRRWHITLGGWFRDYVYIPLGGSRKGTARTLLNMLVVWALSGFWHGAGWTFILWGLWFFAALVIDKYALRRFHAPGIVRRVFALLCVVVGYAFFTAPDLKSAGETLAALFSFRAGPTALFWLRENAVLLAVSVACCVPPVIEAGRRLLGRHTALRCACMLATLLICLAALAKSSYNPFIYFRF